MQEKRTAYHNSVTDFLIEPKFRICRHVLLFILLAVIVLYDSTLTYRDSMGQQEHIVTVRTLLLFLSYSGAIYLNIYVLVPRFLLPKRYRLYMLSFSCIILFLLCAGFMPEIFAGKSSSVRLMIIQFFALTFTYAICIAGSSMPVLFRHWVTSGKRVNELEKSTIQSELEYLKTQVNPDFLFNVLDKSVQLTREAPEQASEILMKLSRLLRRQLYGSARERNSTPYKTGFKSMTTATKHKELLSAFLISSHYRIVRHILLILAVVFIAGQGIGDNPSCLGKELFRAGIMSVILSGIIYANIYVLTPRFLFKNKLAGYILSLLGLVFLAILLIIISQFIAVIPHPNANVEAPAGFILLNLASVIIQFGLFIAGTSTILLFRQWMTNEYRINALENATMLSELEQLKNQINPHFLFNMLNNANVLIRKDPDEAAIVLSKLKDLLKYQINGSSKEEVELKADIQFLTDFLNLEKIRRDRFEFIISAGSDVSRITVPPLLFIPFVENAVKHNNDGMTLSYVHLYFKVENESLHFVCGNSKPNIPQPENGRGGLGLANIKRRLELLYGNDYKLKIIENEITYTVKLQIKL